VYNRAGTANSFCVMMIAKTIFVKTIGKQRDQMTPHLYFMLKMSLDIFGSLALALSAQLLLPSV
jgi:hypothetical protein